MEHSSVYLFGNSPSCNVYKRIAKPDKIAVLGQGIKYINQNNISFWFVRDAQFDQKLSSLSETVVVLSAKEDSRSNNVIAITNSTAKKIASHYDLNITPTLGLFAVLWLKQFFKSIYISGICLNVTDPNIHGYFWNKDDKRLNSYHHLLVECLFLSNMIKREEIYEF